MSKIQRFFSMNKVVHQNIDDHGKVECPICNREIQPYWEPRYTGIRLRNMCDDVGKPCSTSIVVESG